CPAATLARALSASDPPLDFNLSLSAQRVLEGAVHDEYDGNPRHHEIGEEQDQKHENACALRYLSLDNIPDPAGHEGPEHDKNHIEDECFHGEFRSVTPLLLKEQLFAAIKRLLNRPVKCFVWTMTAERVPKTMEECSGLPCQRRPEGTS